MPNIFDSFKRENRGKVRATTATSEFNRRNTSNIDEYGMPVSFETASNSTSFTIWEEIEQELKSQPTGRTDMTSFESASQQNGSGGGNKEERGSKEEMRKRLRIIQEELMFTLASRCNGYGNLDDIKRDFHTDTGYIPDRVAQEYGFQKFKDFFESDLVKGVYKLVLCEGQPAYVPRDCSKFKHIRDEQIISNDTIVRKEDEAEMEKLARALLPENSDKYINGKKVILKILHDLGGETKEVLWMRIQEQYKNETGKELAGEELRKMFQRDKTLKILAQFFKNEVDVIDSTAPGVFYLKLKKPYNEIMQTFDEMIRFQQEDVKKYRSNKRQLHANGGNHRAKMTAEEKFRPLNSLFAPTIDQSLFLEQSTSQSIFKPTPPIANANSAANSPTLGNNEIKRMEPSLSQNSAADKKCISKPKFQIPNDVKGFVSEGSKKTVQITANIQSQPIDWEGQSLTHYGGTTEKEGPVGQSQPADVNKKNSKPKDKASKMKYTSRNTGTYTDSEEEEADNEEEDARSDVTLMGQNGRGDGQNGTEQQQQKGKQDVNPRRRACFDDEPQGQNSNVDNNPSNCVKLGIHQKVIQKYMREKMEQKGMTPQTQRMNSSAIVQQNEPNGVSCNRDKFNLPSMDDVKTTENKETAFTAKNIQQNRVAYDGHHSNAQTDNRQVTNYESYPNLETQRVHDDSVRIAREQHHSGIVLSTGSHPPVDSSRVFQLMDHVEELRKIANEKGFSHETRQDEGSFTFRRGDKLLIFTEFDEEKIRGSVHCSGRLCNDRYFPKVDWDMFYSAILGLLSRNFGG